MGMARGAEVIKGSFTVPLDTTGNYTISFGKSFDRYLYIVEMTEESKVALMQSGQDGNKTFARVGLFPVPAIGDIHSYNYSHMSCRINPATETPITTVAVMNGVTNSTIAIAIGDITAASTNHVYRGFSYNYTIVSLDNV